jgi:hypothetical protein
MCPDSMLMVYCACAARLVCVIVAGGEAAPGRPRCSTCGSMCARTRAAAPSAPRRRCPSRSPGVCVCVCVCVCVELIRLLGVVRHSAQYGWDRGRLGLVSLSTRPGSDLSHNVFPQIEEPHQGVGRQHHCGCSRRLTLGASWTATYAVPELWRNAWTRVAAVHYRKVDGASAH